MPGRLEVHQVLLHPVRETLFRLLEPPGESTIPELAQRVGLTPSGVRWHVHKLQQAGLVAPISEGSAARFRRIETPETALARASRVLQSVPARELMRHLIARPGQHLGEAAAALEAPRSRYWRVVRDLEAAGLVHVRIRVKARLLHPTPLAHQAMRATEHRGWTQIQARMTRRYRPTMAPGAGLVATLLGCHGLAGLGPGVRTSTTAPNPI